MKELKDHWLNPTPTHTTELFEYDEDGKHYVVSECVWNTGKRTYFMTQVIGNIDMVVGKPSAEIKAIINELKGRLS